LKDFKTLASALIWPLMKAMKMEVTFTCRKCGKQITTEVWGIRGGMIQIGGYWASPYICPNCGEKYDWISMDDVED